MKEVRWKEEEVKREEEVEKRVEGRRGWFVCQGMLQSRRWHMDVWNDEMHLSVGLWMIQPRPLRLLNDLEMTAHYAVFLTGYGGMRMRKLNCILSGRLYNLMVFL